MNQKSSTRKMALAAFVFGAVFFAALNTAKAQTSSDGNITIDLDKPGTPAPTPTTPAPRAEAPRATTPPAPVPPVPTDPAPPDGDATTLPPDGGATTPPGQADGPAGTFTDPNPDQYRIWFRVPVLTKGPHFVYRDKAKAYGDSLPHHPECFVHEDGPNSGYDLYYRLPQWTQMNITDTETNQKALAHRLSVKYPTWELVVRADGDGPPDSTNVFPPAGGDMAPVPTLPPADDGISTPPTVDANDAMTPPPTVDANDALTPPPAPDDATPPSE